MTGMQAAVATHPRLPDGSWPSENPARSPAAMARFLLRTTPDTARCFALVMSDHSSWANRDWGSFWADVAELVQPA